MAREKKAIKHEAKGDSHLAKGKPDKALKEYRKALELEPDNAEILDKLVKAQDSLPGEWGMEEFADSVGWTMKRQEKENPSIKQVHAMLSPEWKRVSELAVQILGEEDEVMRGKKIEELVSMGEVATRAMIGLLLQIKNPSPAADEDQKDQDPKP